MLKWVGNPADKVAGLRALTLLPGIGQTTAKTILASMTGTRKPLAALSSFKAPTRTGSAWTAFVRLVKQVRRRHDGWQGSLDAVLAWYRPVLEETYDDAAERFADLEQLRAIAATFKSQRKFLADLMLDPPTKQKRSGGASEESDYVTLSTIHSAKGREWHSVFVLNVVEGAMPSSRARLPSEIEEERRLLYVAMTRAKQKLVLMVPWRGCGHQISHQPSAFSTVARSRFIPDSILRHFKRQAWRGDDTYPVTGQVQADSLRRCVRERWRTGQAAT